MFIKISSLFCVALALDCFLFILVSKKDRSLSHVGYFFDGNSTTMDMAHFFVVAQRMFSPNQSL